MSKLKKIVCLFTALTILGGTCLNGEAEKYTVLKLWDWDESASSPIIALQKRLKELGYFEGEPDGIYGTRTKSAVTVFQRNNRLEITGKADETTQQVLFESTDVVKAGPYDNGSDVTRLQARLIQWGFHSGKPDGIAGENTSNAVIRFKTYLAGMEVDDSLEADIPDTAETDAEDDGYVSSGFEDGMIVLDELLPVKKTTQTSSARFTGSITTEVMEYVDGIQTFQPYRETVQPGDDSDQVWRVQRRLRGLGYLYSVDGHFGDYTQRALKSFQYRNGLEQTGCADRETQTVLFSSDPVKSDEYVNAYKIYVDISEQKVYIYQWDGVSYGELVREIVCSTGLDGDTATPIGTYQAEGPSGLGEWYWFSQYKCYAKWGYHIVGGIMFHSVTFDKNKELNTGSVESLGSKASHGCIRMPIEDAKWIYDNCPRGTTVVISKEGHG